MAAKLPSGRTTRRAGIKTAWPADHVERRPTASLLPYARNARVHTDAQVAQIAASITEYGWTIPVLVNEADELIAGHGRVMAAHLLKLADVPTMVARGWTQAQVRAYRLADNKLALNSEWDVDLLRGEIDDLRELGIDLELAGFSVMEVDQLFAAETDYNAEWEGMPEFGQDDQMAFRRLIVNFPDQESVNRFAKLVKQELTDKTRFIWYPKQALERVADKAYVATE